MAWQKLEDEDYIKKLEQLEQQKKELQAELRVLKKRAKGRIGYLFLFFGILSMLLAIYYSHDVTAFIGISLIFWGALILYIKPNAFMRKEILDSAIVVPLTNTYNLLNELNYKGTPRHVSPGTLRGLRSATLYIPKSDRSKRPSDEQLSSEEIFIKKPSAIRLTPPGLGLHRLLEEELKINFSTILPEVLTNNLEKELVEGLEIAEAFKMEVSQSTVTVEMMGSIFDSIIQEIEDLEAHRRIGDPLTSALACILARSTRKSVIIEKIDREPKKKLTQITFKIENSASEAEI